MPVMCGPPWSAARLGVSAQVLGGWDSGVNATVMGAARVNEWCRSWRIRARGVVPLGLGLLVDRNQGLTWLTPATWPGTRMDPRPDDPLMGVSMSVNGRSQSSDGRCHTLVACRGFDDGQSLALRVGDGGATPRSSAACSACQSGPRYIHGSIEYRSCSRCPRRGWPPT